MQLSDVISILSLLVSLSIAVFVYFEGRDREKRSICFKLWQFWNAVHVREARSQAFDHLISLNLSKPVDLRDLINADPELRYSYSTVFHFFQDLHAFLESNTIDRYLAKRFFFETVSEWYGYLGNKNLILWGKGDQNYLHEELPQKLPDLLRRCPNRKIIKF